jgi:hypothetical protein
MVEVVNSSRRWQKTNGNIRCVSIGIEVPSFAYKFSVASVDSSTVHAIQGLSVNVAAVSCDCLSFCRQTILQLPRNCLFNIFFYYYLAAIGLTPGGSSTVHIYTQTARRIQRTEHT